MSPRRKESEPAPADAQPIEAAPVEAPVEPAPADSTPENKPEPQQDANRRYMLNRNTGVVFPWNQADYEVQARLVECDAKGKPLNQQPEKLPEDPKRRKGTKWANDHRHFEAGI